jgi:hypothetical protein
MRSGHARLRRGANLRTDRSRRERRLLRGITRLGRECSDRKTGNAPRPPLKGLALTARRPQAPKAKEKLRGQRPRLCQPALAGAARGIEAEGPKPGDLSAVASAKAEAEVRFTRARSGLRPDAPFTITALPYSVTLAEVPRAQRTFF